MCRHTQKHNYGHHFKVVLSHVILCLINILMNLCFVRLAHCSLLVQFGDGSKEYISAMSEIIPYFIISPLECSIRDITILTA